MPEKTYLSRRFDLRGASPRLEFDGTEWTIYESDKGRVQIKLLVAREPGHVTRFSTYWQEAASARRAR